MPARSARRGPHWYSAPPETKQRLFFAIFFAIFLRPTEQICPDSAGPFIVSILLALLFSLSPRAFIAHCPAANMVVTRAERRLSENRNSIALRLMVINAAVARSHSNAY